MNTNIKLNNKRTYDWNSIKMDPIEQKEYNLLQMEQIVSFATEQKLDMNEASRLWISQNVDAFRKHYYLNKVQTNLKIRKPFVKL